MIKHYLYQCAYHYFPLQGTTSSIYTNIYLFVYMTTQNPTHTIPETLLASCGCV